MEAIRARWIKVSSILRIQGQCLLEGWTSFGGRPAAQGIALEQELAQLLPRLDIIGMFVNGFPVEILGLRPLPRPPGPQGLDQQTVVRRKPALERSRRVGGKLRHAVLSQPFRHDAQPVVGQGEGGVERESVSEGLLGGEVPAGAELALPREVALQGLERAGGGRRDSAQPLSRGLLALGQDLGGELIHQVEEIRRLALDGHLRHRLLAAFLVVHRGAQLEPASAFDHVPEQVEAGTESCRHIARLGGRLDRRIALCQPAQQRPWIDASGLARALEVTRQEIHQAGAQILHFGAALDRKGEHRHQPGLGRRRRGVPPDPYDDGDRNVHQHEKDDRGSQEAP